MKAALLEKSREGAGHVKRWAWPCANEPCDICKSADIWLCLERLERKIKQERSHVEHEANGSCPSARIQNKCMSMFC